MFASAQKDVDSADSLGNGPMKSFDRSVGAADLRQGVLAISGTSRRVGSPGDEKEGLGPDELASAEAEFRREYPEKKMPSSLPDRFFRYVRARPLLILRFVSPDAPDDLQSLLPQGNILAWTISFPKSEIEGGTVEYIVNTIRMREMFGEEEIEEEALGDTD